MEFVRAALAPAKINLGLRITGRYANGYHRLESVFVPISVFDRLSISAGVRDTVIHTWPASATATQRRRLEFGAQQNPLLLKTIAFARSYLLQAHALTLPALRVTAVKRIPSPAGLGGASADAAVLLAEICRNMLSMESTRAALDSILRETEALGADVPFFLKHGLQGQAAILCGVGHELTPVTISPLCGYIAVPAFGFSTAQMFAEVRGWKLPAAETAEASTLGANLTLRLNEIPYSDEPLNGVRVVQNDFDTAAQAVFPSESRVLAQAKLTLAKTMSQFFPGAWVVGMTGSGAGLFSATDMTIPMRRLTSLSGVLRTRLGSDWQVLPFKSIGP
jgi:4-diphosphocytidyl-2C-methyl-D-erythritol kinase